MKLVRSRTILFLITILCLISMDSKSQQKQVEFRPDQYRAVNWTSDDGLTLGIHYVLKDSRRFTWVGAAYSPLFRFDGVQFKKIVHDPKKPGTILEGGI